MLQLKPVDVEQALQRHDKYGILNKVLTVLHRQQQNLSAYPVGWNVSIASEKRYNFYNHHVPFQHKLQVSR